jgi:intein-encoded DNA endonuclease-like protein
VGRRRDYTPAPKITKPYLLGLLHDATSRNTTYRISSKSKDFCLIIQAEIRKIGGNAWVYKEGKDRNLWVTEFSKSFVKKIGINSRKEKIDYLRGYFDAEGGIAKDPKVRFYLYFCQKNREDLIQVRKYLTELKISCGVIHNPSRRIDPNYWRFFIKAKSYRDFARIIGSNHPEKAKLLRKKI